MSRTNKGQATPPRYEPMKQGTEAAMSKAVETHRIEPCRKPKAWRRRWRNTIWVCPECGQGWVSKKSNRRPPIAPSTSRMHAMYDHSFWGWWPWPDWRVIADGKS